MVLAWGESYLLPWMQPVLTTSSTTTLGSWLEQVSDSQPPAATLPSAGRSSPELLCLGASWFALLEEPW